MKRTRIITIVVVILALLGLSLNITAPPAAAQSGRTIVSAVFSTYVWGPSGHTVNAHEITAAWDANTVTWASFGGAFNPAVIGSFLPNAAGWYTVNVTSLVQAWVNTPASNHGLLLEEPGAAVSFSQYHSSDYTVDTTLRPKLDIDYTNAGAPATILHLTIQQGLAQGTTVGNVPDTFIEQALPNQNWGTSPFLVTGRNDPSAPTLVKQALFQFDLRSPTAVTLQSFDARPASAPDLTLPALGVLGMVGIVALRLRRTSKRAPSQMKH